MNKQNNKKIDNMMNELNNCTDKNCGNIIASKQLKDEGLKFLKIVNKKCRSKKVPKNEEEYKLDREKYNKCFEKLKKSSTYNKKLTQRNKCQVKKCSVYQDKIVKMLSSKKT
jgi:hypothetical protein